MLAKIGHAPHARPDQFGRKESLMDMQKSEVAQLLQRISLECEAATRGLTGLSAGRAKHSFITARLEQIGVYHEQLASLGLGKCRQRSSSSSSLKSARKTAHHVDLYWLAQGHTCSSLHFRDSDGIRIGLRGNLAFTLGF